MALTTCANASVTFRLALALVSTAAQLRAAANSRAASTLTFERREARRGLGSQFV